VKRFTSLAAVALVAAVLTVTGGGAARADTTAVHSQGELRAALAQASADGTGPHTIVIANDFTVQAPSPTYTGSRPLTIRGGGHLVTGGAGVRFLDHRSSALVTIIALRAEAFAPARGAGAVVRADGPVTVRDSAFADNRAPRVGGGVIEAGRRVTILRSRFQDNVGFEGGAARSNFRVVVEDSRFIGNRADVRNGGALASFRGTVTVRRSTFVDNEAKGFGGAVDGDRIDVTGSDFAQNRTIAGNFGGALSANDVRVRSSSFRANHAGQGGAIAGRSIDVAASTFVGNIADADGGAIFAEAISLDAVTMSRNRADDGAHLFGNAGSLTIRRSVLVGAQGGQSCDSWGSGTRSGSYVSDHSCPTGVGNRGGPGPLFQPLREAANHTWILEPRPGTVIVDALRDCGPLTLDQRGLRRPQGPRCDMGAVERRA
jgi:predicted outer membrane repeat protein